MRLAKGYRIAANPTTPGQKVSFEAAARRYMAERMPKRYTTASGYRNNLEKYIIPKWGSLDLGPSNRSRSIDGSTLYPLRKRQKRM